MLSFRGDRRSGSLNETAAGASTARSHHGTEGQAVNSGEPRRRHRRVSCRKRPRGPVVCDLSPELWSLVLVSRTAPRRLRGYREGSAAAPLPHHFQGKAREAKGITARIISGRSGAYHPLIAGSLQGGEGPRALAPDGRTAHFGARVQPGIPSGPEGLGPARAIRLYLVASGPADARCGRTP